MTNFVYSMTKFVYTYDTYCMTNCLHMTHFVLFCFVLFALQLSVCLWWHDYRRDDFPTLKFGVVMADLLAIC